MKIYIAGPMRGIKDFNFPAFFEAEKILKKKGYDVWNPARKDKEEGFNPRKGNAQNMKYYMTRDLPALLKCDAICLLPGWEHGKGACIEADVALAGGLKVFEFRDGKEKEIGLQYETTLQDHCMNILEEALHITHDDRNKDYDEAVRNHVQIAEIASAILRKDIEARDVAIIQIATKLSRESFKHKRDNLVDLAGYAYVLSKIEGD
jgi:nucleoside 2-deoxyribosyltransferase